MIVHLWNLLNTPVNSLTLDQGIVVGVVGITLLASSLIILFSLAGALEWAIRKVAGK